MLKGMLRGIAGLEFSTFLAEFSSGGHTLYVSKKERVGA
jgi:hypothetical protein